MDKPITFAGIDDLPATVVSLASMEWNHTGTWRYLRPSYDNKVPACSHACPAGTDIEGFIRLLGEGRFTEAWLALKEENPLTRVCGRVCFHPCEASCNRSRYDLPVAINALERFAGEHADRSRLALSCAPSTGKRVAVVGSGPAGLAAAFYLARLGHGVTIFEMMLEPGGILRYGIPEHRLPRDVLDDEIDDIRALGVEIRCGVRVGGDGGLAYAELAAFDAVFLAVGAHRSRAMRIPGEHAPQVMSGLTLLRRVAAREPVPVGERAAVIGGGNTALDAARSLRRLGAEVDLYYRRGRAEMPAFGEEVDEAVREGVALHVLRAPTCVELNDAGDVVGLTMVRMQLGAADASGRRSPEPIAGSEYRVAADMVVTAIGEVIASDDLPAGMPTESDGSIRVDALGRAGTGRFWAGGDATPATRTVVTAVAAGKRAALALDRSLRGGDGCGGFALAAAGADAGEAEGLPQVGGPGGGVSMSRYRAALALDGSLGTRVAHANYDSPDKVVRFDDLNVAYFKKQERQRAARLPVHERLADGAHAAEVNRGFTQAQALAEAVRCFHCGVCTECDNCYIFCPDVAIHRRAGGGYEINYDFCKGCGICVTECPRASMALADE